MTYWHELSRVRGGLAQYSKNNQAKQIVRRGEHNPEIFEAHYERKEPEVEGLPVVNPPMALLSGATTPVEAMPRILQPLTMFNPVRHFSIIARGVMIKGVGMDILWPNFLALLGFAVVLVGFSVSRYRKQLS